MDLRISFSKSKSAMYSKVIRQCQMFAGFSQEEGFNVLTLSFKDIVENWNTFNSIFHTTCKWASFRYILKDQPITDYSEIKKVFYSLQELMYCIRSFQKELDKNEYCEGGQFWGCHRLKSIEVLPSFYTVNKGWYTIGSLDDGFWKIDKARILKILLNEAKEKLVYNCPNFKEDRIRDVVYALPDQLDIATRHWKLITSTKFLNGKFQQVCTAIEWKGSYAEFKPEEFLHQNK